MDELIELVGRFVLGRVLFRERSRWDARYLTWAPPIPDWRRLMPGEEYPRTTWARRPGFHRQFVRFAALAVLAVGVVVPLVIAAVALVVGLVVSVVKAVRMVRRRRIMRVAEPFDEPLAEQLGWGDVPVYHWIDLPRGSWEFGPISVPHALSASGLSWLHRAPYGAQIARAIAASVWWLANSRLRVPHRIPALPLKDPDATITIHYPKSYSGHAENVKEAVRIVTDRLDGEWEHTHHPRRLTIELAHPVKFPDKFEITRETFAQYSVTEVPFAVGKSGNVETIPLKKKTPHVSASATTGWGKTTFANVLLGNQLYHGAYAVLVDPKLVGYTHFAGLDNVEINTSFRGQIHAIRRVLEEMNRRYEVIEAYGQRAAELGLPSMKENPELYFRPLVYLEDEKGSFTVAIKSWWKRAPVEEWEFDYKDGKVNEETGDIEGKPGRGDPKPLLDQQEILWRGRAAAINMVTLAQQNNLYVFLNSDMRDQYMMRILYGPQTNSSWRMTFPGVRQKKLGSKKGRGVAGIGAEEQRDILGGVITDTETRAAAEDGARLAEELDQHRAELLAQATGRPVWEVSPLADWMRTQTRIAAQTHTSVPGQRPGTGTSHLTLIHGNGHTSTSPPSATPAITAAPEPENPPGQPSDSGDVITGMEAAAEFLGMSKDAFIQMRKRDKRKGVTIAGESLREDGVLTFEKVALEEWRNQYHPQSARSKKTGTTR